ncbi:MAG: NADP-dependent malic enzyme [Acetobacteraceae bacterium]|nr:NADP-dependent malic enzyme [Acetobacteraceae bacterium]
MTEGSQDQLAQAAIQYHSYPTPGKIAVTPTKSMSNQRDLALAYSPGVAVACMEIHKDPANASKLTSRANLVAVVSNGTAVLGLGNIGALAGKPVMEGKGCLFKKFAGIDVFDIEVDATEPDKIVEIVASLEPTFGGINLEDIKAPECFEIERKLRSRMRIPVFHDDQHGTAIVTAAAIINGLKVVRKRIENAKCVVSGAGAAAIACLDLLVGLGLRKDNVIVCDSRGVIYKGRSQGMDPSKEAYAAETSARTLAEAIPGADIFLGLSMAGVLKPEMVQQMADRPLILALANPEPEIRPELAKQTRPDCVIATGRSDYPNQVNNVLCFPFIFRGALDVGATTINEEMKLAATRALADLAQAEQSDVVAAAYGVRDKFGPEHLIPRPFDPRLITTVAPAVAEAAMRSGVATRPIQDMREYRDRLGGFVYRSGTVMQPLFHLAAGSKKRIIYAEGEDERVLRAAQAVVDENLARPILIGRPDIIRQQIRDLGLRLTSQDYEVVELERETPTLSALIDEYYNLRCRQGVTRSQAEIQMRRDSTLVGATLVRRGEADGMLCGVAATYDEQLRRVRGVIGMREGVRTLAAMNMLMLTDGTIFICDTQINYDPWADQIVEMTLLAAEVVRRFGLTPRAALLSHSNFGSSDTPSARKMREATHMLWSRAPDLEVDGELHGSAALSEAVRDRVMPNSRLKGNANLLIMPNLDSANITLSCMRVTASQGVTVGPILLGAAKPVHILLPTTTVRGIVNMTVLTAVHASIKR